MPEGEAFAVFNNQEGIDSLIERLQEERPELVVLEASGRYERPAAAAIAASCHPRGRGQSPPSSRLRQGHRTPRKDRANRRRDPRLLRRSRGS